MNKQHIDPNAAYNAQVRRILEILSPEFEYYWDKELRNKEIDDILTEAARAMVAEMASAVREGMRGFNSPRFTESYLIERGLIPEPCKHEPPYGHPGEGKVKCKQCGKILNPSPENEQK